MLNCKSPFLGIYGRHPSGEDDFNDFYNGGILIDFFTLSESIMNDLSIDIGDTSILRFGDCPERIVDCNMIFTLPMDFRDRQDQVPKVNKKLWDIITKKPTAVKLEDETSKQVELGVVKIETPGKLSFNKPSKGMTQHLNQLYIKINIEG